MALSTRETFMLQHQKTRFMHPILFVKKANEKYSQMLTTTGLSCGVCRYWTTWTVGHSDITDCTIKGLQGSVSIKSWYVAKLFPDKGDVRQHFFENS